MVRFEYGEAGARRVLTMCNGELLVRPMQSNDSYIAISHTWGDLRNTIEGIGWNVASWISDQECKALVQAFGKIWIDSLCIKQDEELDKSLQVKDMYNTYVKAQKAVVVLTGNYEVHLTALRRVTQLLVDLGKVGECSSTPDCPYITTLEEISVVASTLREMPWFRRVWTLQEAVISSSLTFVGFQGDMLQTDVMTEDELYELVREYEHVNDIDVESNKWLRSITHLCTANRLDPLSVALFVVKVVDSVRLAFSPWYKDFSGKKAVNTLHRTMALVCKQVGRNNRECEKPNDLVYGVCALLEININDMDSTRQFEGLFFEALNDLVGRGVFVLPTRPHVIHGKTWLPSLEHIASGDAWRTVKSSYVFNEFLDTYHKIICAGASIYAKGVLVQFHNPQVLCVNMDGAKKLLESIVQSVLNCEDFNVSNIDPPLLTITCVVLWMFRQSGNEDCVMTREVESLIHLVHNHMHSQIIEEIERARPAILFLIKSNLHLATRSQNVHFILQSCSLCSEDHNDVYKNVTMRGDRSVVLVYQKKIGLVLYNAHESFVRPYSSYGVFYKNSTTSRVREINCNILARNDDGIWDNHGQAAFWYITRSWSIDQRRVPIGTLQ
jgi:hypothetical protein